MIVGYIMNGTQHDGDTDKLTLFPYVSDYGYLKTGYISEVASIADDYEWKVKDLGQKEVKCNFYELFFNELIKLFLRYNIKAIFF